MRKSEPDSKYFGESSENEVFPVKTYKNHPKTANCLLCTFLRNWSALSLHHFGQCNFANFKLTYLKKLQELELPVQMRENHRGKDITVRSSFPRRSRSAHTTRCRACKNLQQMSPNITFYDMPIWSGSHSQIYMFQTESRKGGGFPKQIWLDFGGFSRDPSYFEGGLHIEMLGNTIDLHVATIL